MLTRKLLVAALIIAGSHATVAAQNLTRWVDPFLGTGGHGHTYPGATRPFGMVQLSPDNGTEGTGAAAITTAAIVLPGLVIPI